MTLAPTLQRLLEQLGPAEQMSFPKLLEAIHAVKFTGPITLHCFQGTPQQVDIGAPIRLSIVEGGLDRTNPPRTG